MNLQGVQVEGSKGHGNVQVKGARALNENFGKKKFYTCEKFCEKDKKNIGKI